jgi:hypothetical protein
MLLYRCIISRPSGAPECSHGWSDAASASLHPWKTLRTILAPAGRRNSPAQHHDRSIPPSLRDGLDVEPSFGGYARLPRVAPVATFRRPSGAKACRPNEMTLSRAVCRRSNRAKSRRAANVSWRVAPPTAPTCQLTLAARLEHRSWRRRGGESTANLLGSSSSVFKK